VVSFAIPRQRVRIIKGSIKNFLLFALRGTLIKGSSLGEFEKKFAKYHGVPYALAVSSGRFSLELILSALQLKPEDEVILPAYTFKAIAALIKKMGFKNVFVDVSLETYTMNHLEVEKLITPKTRVIIATHILGNPCNMPEIMLLAKKKNIFVIEDCAQAIGAEIQGKKVGSFADAAIFSMETIKLMHTYGGGVITVSHKHLYQNIMKKVAALNTISTGQLIKKVSFTIFEYLLTSPWIFSLLLWPVLLLSENVLSMNLEKIFKRVKRNVKGFKGGRMTNYQASVGIAELKTIDSRIAKIEANVSLLKKLISSPSEKKIISKKPVFPSFVIRTKEKTHLKKKLLLRGIDSGLESSQNCASLFFSDQKYISATILENELLQLPLNETTTHKDIIRMGKHINRGDI